MCVLPYYVEKKLANALKSLMCADDRSSAFATSIHKEDTRFEELQSPLPEVVS